MQTDPMTLSAAMRKPVPATRRPRGGFRFKHCQDSFYRVFRTDRSAVMQFDRRTPQRHSPSSGVPLALMHDQALRMPAG